MTAGDVIVARGNLHARQGAAFDGTDDYILADAHAVARVAAGDPAGTYSAWIYFDAVTSANQVILSGGDNDSADQLFNIQIEATSGKLGTYLKVGGAAQFSILESVATIAPKRWIHVALVQNGIRPELYVNGIKTTTTLVTTTDLAAWYAQLTLCDKFAIGVQETNGTHVQDFAGMISDVKYWNKALTAAEVLSDYQGTALSDDGTYLQLHLLKSNYGATGYGVTDKGLGADNGTLTGHAYLTGWGSEWSRMTDLSGAVVADTLQTIKDDNVATTLILKAA